MADLTKIVCIKVYLFSIENLIKRLEIVADHCDEENHQPMVGTIYEAVEHFKNLIESIK